MAFNLLSDPFFPVITRSGYRRWLAFADLAVVDGDYPIDFDWPRADFNMAAYEFAIGVATLTLRPLTRSEWGRLWLAPPDHDAVARAIETWAYAFNLDGDGPRFLQEFGGLNGEKKPIEALLIDTPGDNGQKKNTDLLTHRERYPAMGLPAVAVALYALQQFAPSGGAGNRTSMRGGGPLTTLVVPGGEGGARVPLWRTILANVVDAEINEVDAADHAKILPWLTRTILSDKASGERCVQQTDDDVHPLQCFFGMPRRLILSPSEPGVCAMTSQDGPVIRRFVQQPWGVNYGDWRHPLTPYRRLKESEAPYTFKPKSGRFGYRDWVATTVGTADDKLALPATVVAKARKERPSALCGASGAESSLRVGGWALNNMEAVAYLAAEQPLHLAQTTEAQGAIVDAARRFAAGGDVAASLLRQALKSALFADGAKPATDTAVFAEARASFYARTEDAFHVALTVLLDEGDTPSDTGAYAWLLVLAKSAREVFDASAPISIADVEKARRHASAFGVMSAALRGYGKMGAVLFEALEIALPIAAANSPGRKQGSRDARS